MSETIDSMTGEVSQKNIADIINEARAVDRISARDIIDQVFTDFFELHGDHQLTDDEAIVGGIARFNDQAVTVIGIQKEAYKAHCMIFVSDGYIYVINIADYAVFNDSFNRLIHRF